MATLVMKFGGSLMADAQKISRVAQVILAEALAWPRMVVIISAMAGVTDKLMRAADQAAQRDAAGYRRTVAQLRADHLSVIEALFEEEARRRDLVHRTDNLLFDVLAQCDSIAARHEAFPRDRDLILAVGERMMLQILVTLVQQEGLKAAAVDASSLIVTDERHLSANPLIDLIDERVEQIIRPLLEASIVPVITGYIGATRTGEITTLGRGGSDYTATILAASLHADEVWLWTNVDGVMSADPALVPGSRVIPVLSYSEIEELSYFGAHVLHPRAVEPLVAEGIPLRVRNPENLDHAGTLVQAESAETGTALKAVTAVDGLWLSTRDQSIDLGEFLGQLQGIVGHTATGPVIVMQGHEQATLVFVVPTSEGPTAAAAAAQRLSVKLGAEHWEVRVVKVIAAMGTAAFTPIPDLNNLGSIQPLASVLGPDNRRLIAVEPQDVQTVVRQLHKLTVPGVGAKPGWGEHYP